MQKEILTMKLLEEKYGVCRLEKEAIIPEWASRDEFFSITKTSDELSIVCLERDIPMDTVCERGWRILKIEGPLDFSLIGIMASISSILAQKGISIFAISTYDTDYILVKNTDVDNAVETLVSERYKVI
ncbi:hypothetical protein SAMN02745163_03495 [Clostridium cavendishii DSM 21758]|uniref:Uncharacterized protein n=1 Tax=Clostridium cavendishii DSM 21758 TaxID=1121302 RepID=A0A1M6QYH4_9CLOT|nr:ACT domain-containing protein [Clostridium cavendishii]SHK25281.1 hypothetical protein SAMN02745163_03495 [Clostridium cavendishii DSM 21758]